MAQKLYSCDHPMDEETPGPCSWCEGNLLHTLKCLTAERDKARLALKDLFLMMDEDILVRNTDGDGKPDFTLRMLSVVQRLKEAHDAITYDGIPEKKLLEERDSK